MTPELECPICKSPMRYDEGDCGWEALRAPEAFHCEQCGTIVPVSALKHKDGQP